jgi:hypothetical protein
MLCTIIIDLFKGFDKIVSIGNLVLFFESRISPRIRAQIGTARNVAQGTHEEPIYEKKQKIRLSTMSL